MRKKDSICSSDRPLVSGTQQPVNTRLATQTAAKKKKGTCRPKAFWGCEGDDLVTRGSRGPPSVGQPWGPSPYSPAQGPCGAPHCLPFRRKCFSMARPAGSSGLSLGSGTCLPPTSRRPGPPAWRGASACVSAAATQVLLPGPPAPLRGCRAHSMGSPALPCPAGYTRGGPRPSRPGQIVPSGRWA